ncbi:MAG: nucleoside triphosphate pyrophosphohydrolase [Spirochaetaceae bacterium]|nr:nucleoside triphosphate pyrophosphohydrolase [Spirochaetaceae bacterium]
MTELLQSFEQFFSVIQKLRAPDGCPWDKEQTPLSIRGDLIEETFEAIEAITDGDILHVKEELGDVMLNVLMMAYMYQQQGAFSVSDVMKDVSEKLIRRHPHVFKESEGVSQMKGQISSSAEVLSQWDQIKRNVEGRGTESILDEVPKGFPPLTKAAKLQKKASKKGFDWQNVQQIEDKLLEELEEVRQAAKILSAEKEKNENKINAFIQGSSKTINKAQLNLEAEIGDLLFSVVNLARRYKVDPAVALSRTNEKFCRRFKYVEKKMALSDLSMDSNHLQEMDIFWNEAKDIEP